MSRCEPAANGSGTGRALKSQIKPCHFHPCKKQKGARTRSSARPGGRASCGLQRAGGTRRSARGRGWRRYGLCAARAAKLGNRRVYGIKHLKQIVKRRCRVIRFNQKQSSAQLPRRGSRRISSAAGKGWEPSGAARTALSRPKPREQVQHLAAGTRRPPEPRSSARRAGPRPTGGKQLRSAGREPRAQRSERGHGQGRLKAGEVAARSHAQYRTKATFLLQL